MTGGMPLLRPRRPRIVWDEHNLAHIHERGRCDEAEVSDVLFGTCHTSRRELLPVPAGATTKWQYFGQTCQGRFLVVIAEEVVATKENVGGVRPITCWPLSDRELTRYLAWRRTRKAR
jgi:hypothetical protein